MYPNSIFNLPRKKSDLISANQNLHNLYYDEIAPLRNIIDSGNNNNQFGNSTISFRTVPSCGTWLIPSRSYFRIDCELSRPGGDPLTMNNNIAVNMGLASNLFLRAQYKINDKTISEITESMAQIDALKTRLRRSGQWMNTIGAQCNFWQSSVQDRLNLTCSNGYFPGRNYAAMLPITTLVQLPGSVITVGNDQIQFDYEYAADQSAFQFTDQAGNDLFFGNRPAQNGEWIPSDDELLLANLKRGDMVSYMIQGNNYVGTIVSFTSTGQNDNGGLNRIIITQHQGNIELPDIGVQSINVSAAGGGFQLRKLANKADAKDRQIKKFSLIYQPPLSIFSIPHAIPGSSKHEIDMVPYSNTEYQKRAIESLLADKVHTTDGANNNFRFKVTNMLFYAARCDAAIIEKDEFMLDLEEMRLSMSNITIAQRTQFSLNVSKSTHALSVAFQDEAADTSTLYSASKFKIRNDEELGLTNFYIRYGGKSRPIPDYRPVYDESAYTDLMVEQYGRSLLYNGAYFDGSAETLREFRERGLFMHFPWPKTGTDKESRCYVSTEFKTLSATPRLLLFEHYNKVVILRYENGNLVKVLCNEV